MADQQQPQPRNIFEAINQNIVDLSYDIVEISKKVEAIYTALYPPIPAEAPTPKSQNSPA